MLLVFLGGGIGSALRYAVQCAMGSHAFPWATLAVNVAGSFLIGLFGALSAKFGWPEVTRLLLTTGLCGGFTTFSTFSNESLSLLKNGETFVFAAYVLGSLTLGLAAVFAGFTLGGRLAPR